MLKYGKLEYDYLNQAWVNDGKYLPCNHPWPSCNLCYGTQHEGEPVDPEALQQGKVR